MNIYRIVSRQSTINQIKLNLIVLKAVGWKISWCSRSSQTYVWEFHIQVRFWLHLHHHHHHQTIKNNSIQEKGWYMHTIIWYHVILTLKFENITGLFFFWSKVGITTFVNVSLSLSFFNNSPVLYSKNFPSYLGHFWRSYQALHVVASQYSKRLTKLKVKEIQLLNHFFLQNYTLILTTCCLKLTPYMTPQGVEKKVSFIDFLLNPISWRNFMFFFFICIVRSK